jgi:hypothetical protein
MTTDDVDLFLRDGIKLGFMLWRQVPNGVIATFMEFSCMPYNVM